MKLVCAFFAMPATIGRNRAGAPAGRRPKTSFIRRGGIAEPSA